MVIASQRVMLLKSLLELVMTNEADEHTVNVSDGNTESHGTDDKYITGADRKP